MDHDSNPGAPDIDCGALLERGHNLGLRQPPNRRVAQGHAVAPSELDAGLLTGSTTVEGGTEVCNVLRGDAEIPPDCGQIRHDKPLRAIARRQLVSGIDA